MSPHTLSAVPPVAPVGRMADDTFHELIYQHEGALLRYVSKLVSHDLHLAQDIVQETMLRAWTRAQTVRDGYSSLRPWLFTVARNLVFDHRRARSARPAETEAPEFDTMPLTDNRIDQIAEQQAMRQAMALLTPTHRATLEAVYYQELSLAEAADALDIPIGTVKSRLHYAQQALRLAIGDQWTDSGSRRTPQAISRRPSRASIPAANAA